MRASLLSALILIPMTAFAATNEPTLDLPKRDYATTLTKENLVFLRELVRLIEAKGYRQVRVLPQMFVVTVEGNNGKARTLILDSNTLQSFAIEKDVSDLINPKSSVPEGTVLPLH